MSELERLREDLGLLEIPLEDFARPFYHSSYVNESPQPIESNERLEFLGDAVVALAVTEYLFANYPDMSEGELTKIKSAAVSGSVLAKRARALGLDRCFLLGHGEEASAGRQRRSLLGDAFEALIGLVFERLGYQRASRLVVELLRDEITWAGEHRQDYKTLLQEWAQARGQKPIYILVGTDGADHCKEFTVRVQVNGLIALGRGRSKKEAEQIAAQQLYERLSATSPNI